MSQSRHALMASGVITIGLLVGGCASLKQPYPDRKRYAITIETPNKASVTPREGVLKVRRLRISPPFDDLGFSYKVSQNEFSTDYYNAFLTSPAELLTAELIDHLSTNGAFQSVVLAGSSADSQVVLEGDITGLYGDYTDAGSPYAVIEARFFLLDMRDDPVRVLSQNTYSQRVACAGGDAPALVAAWSRAYAAMLADLNTDMASVSVAPDANAR